MTSEQSAFKTFFQLKQGMRDRNNISPDRREWEEEMLSLNKCHVGKCQ